MSIATSLTALATAKTDIAAAITAKGGTVNAGDGFSDFATDIGTISAAGTYQSKTVTPDAAGQTVTPDTGYDALSSVTINADADLVAGNIKKDVSIFGVTGTYGGSTPTKGFLPTSWDANGYVTEGTLYGMTAIPSRYFINPSASQGHFCKLVSLLFPTGLKTINVYAFEYCSSLALTSMPDEITTISDYAFRYCTTLALSSLPANLSSIGAQSFANCAALAITILPSGVNSIGSSAFRACTNLSTIWIPSACSSISASSYSNSPFYQCSSGLTLYCEAASKPAGWGTYWNYYDSTHQLTVVWDTTLSEFEAL